LRAATAIAILAALSFLTWRQVGYWENDYDLWSHALTISPDNPLVVSNLGDTLNRMGRAQEALPVLERATELIPESPDRHGNLAVDLVQCGRLQDAIREYETGISLASDITMKSHFYESLAAVYDAFGDYGKVRESYQQALQVNPQRTAEMVQWLSQSVTTQSSAPRYVQLGILLQETGKLPEARVAYQQALKLDPTLAEAKESLHALQRSNK
jgi:tetratricopeptide (TPR) repeat protein